MNMLKHVLFVVTLLASLLPFPVWGQQAAGNSIGTVTALQGQATVGRVALPQPTSMKFRDDVFFRDQITTKEQSTLRLLLGGKGVLTIREQSQVTLDESVAPTGERRSVLSLLGGKIAAAIGRSLMRPGEEIEVRTPNAVAAVRGTVLIAEYIPPQTSAEAPKPILLASSDPTFRVAQATTSATGQTTFLVLTGSVTVTAQGAPPVTVGAMQTVSISVGPAGVVQVGAVQTATQAQVAQATQGLQMEKSISGLGDGGKAAQAQVQVAATLTNAIVQATSAASAPAAPPVQQPSSTPVPDATQTPPVPTTTPQNDLPSGPLLSLSNLSMLVPGGTTVMTFANGTPTPVVPIALSGSGAGSTIVDLAAAGSFDILGNPITHSGPLLSLNASTLGRQTDVGTSLMRFSGTTATMSNPTAAFATVENNSQLWMAGNLFTLAGGGTMNGSGTALNISGASSVGTMEQVFYIQGGSTFNWSGGPLIRMTGISMDQPARLMANQFGQSDGSGNRITINASFIDATNAEIMFFDQPRNRTTDIDVTIFDPPAGVPQIRLTNSHLEMTGGDSSVVDFGSSSRMMTAYNGLLLIATGSSIFVAGGLVDIHMGDGYAGSTTEASAALVQLDNTFVESTPGVWNSSLISFHGNGSLTVTGPLMAATGGMLMTYGSLLSMDQASLNVTTNQPFIQLTNAQFLNSQAALALSASPVISLANGASLTLAGPLMSVSGGTVDANGPLLRLDNALLNAANATIFQVTGGGVTSNKTDTSGGIYLYNSQIMAVQVANLNNSQIQITNGPLLSVTGGSQMTITGDLATLTNGAKITVSNGPMINVDGATSKLTVNGALANFVGIGNKVIITNSLTPNSPSLSGPFIPTQTSGGGTVTFGPGSNVVRNPGGGSVTVNGVDLASGGPHTGSVITAVNGGTVVIKGQ
jgi:hypothetical protein